MDDFVTGHDLTIAVTHDFDVDAFVVGVGIAVIAPEESADFHLVCSRGKRFEPVGGYFDNLGGTELIGLRIAQLLKSEGLKAYAVAVLIFPDQNGKPSVFVACGDDLSVGGHEQHRHRAVDDPLHMLNPLHQTVALVDQSGDQFGAIDLAGAHGHELVPVIGEVGVHQLLGVVDLTDGGDGIEPEMRTHQKRLGIGVTDAADAAAAALEVRQVFFKLGPERGVGDGVDLPLTSMLRAPDRHPGVAGAEMAVIVGTEEDVKNDVASGYRSEKTAHQAKKSSESVIGSMY